MIENNKVSIRVLLVDDDIAYRELCRRYLLKDDRTDYVVSEAGDATEAMKLVSCEAFDCCVVDFCLPECNGIELIEQIREQLGSKAPPAIVFSAEGGEDAAVEALRARAADFLPKRVVSKASLGRSISNAVDKHRLERRIEDQNQELADANQDLVSKSRQIERFYQHVSHEVKTPLAATREFIAIVRDEIAGPVTMEQEEMLMHALDGCDQISNHFNELVEITRLDSGKIVLDRQLGSFSGVATRCFAAAKAALRSNRVSLERCIPADLPLFEFDRNRMVQVIANLLGNAIKYTDPGGTVKLSIAYYTEESVIDIQVSDTGCGISEENLPHVFERLYQVNANNDEFSGAGLGLGLSIAKEIVHLHGGTIIAESTINVGSTFTVRIPIEYERKE